MIKKWLQANKVMFPIMVVSILMVGGALLIAFSGYYSTTIDVNGGFKLIPEEIVQPVPPAEEIPVVENIVEDPVAAPAAVEEPVPEIVLYPNHGISCTLIAPLDTIETQRYAAAKGCDLILMPYIDEYRLCNIVTSGCVLIDESVILKRY